MVPGFGSSHLVIIFAVPHRYLLVVIQTLGFMWNTFVPVKRACVVFDMIQGFVTLSTLVSLLERLFSMVPYSHKETGVGASVVVVPVSRRNPAACGR